MRILIAANPLNPKKEEIEFRKSTVFFLSFKKKYGSLAANPSISRQIVSRLGLLRHLLPRKKDCYSPIMKQAAP
jgi:hypothetical protein